MGWAKAFASVSMGLDAHGVVHGNIWLLLDGSDGSLTTTTAAHAVLLTPAAPEGGIGFLPHSKG